jgi:hypothetical protein
MLFVELQYKARKFGINCYNTNELRIQARNKKCINSKKKNKSFYRRVMK